MKFSENIFKKCGGRCCICEKVYICPTGNPKAFNPVTKE